MMDERELQALVDVAANGAIRELERHANTTRQGRRELEDAIEVVIRRLVEDRLLTREDDE